MTQGSTPPRILCIVAGQRSGTTALRSALERSGAFHDFGEIFHTQGDQREGMFLPYARATGLRVSDMATDEGADAVADAYLEHVTGLAGDRVCLLDVKHNSWSTLRPFWSYPSQEPFFLRKMRVRGAAFIFLRRRDLTGQIVSEQIARASGQWHDLHAYSGSITVDVAAARRQAEQTLWAEALLYPHVTQTGRSILVDYEDMFDGPDVAAPLTDWLAKRYAIGPELLPLQPKIQKNRVRKRQSVENYDEVAAAIRAVEARMGRVGGAAAAR